MALIKLNNQSLSAVTSAGLPSGTVLQVITSEISGASYEATTSFADVGLSATITPSSSNSKILALHSSPCITNGTQDAIVLLLRGSTTIYNFNLYTNISSWTAATTTFSYVDSPATTSATTYKIQARKAAGAGAYFYYCYTNAVQSQATLTLLEIAG